MTLKTNQTSFGGRISDSGGVLRGTVVMGTVGVILTGTRKGGDETYEYVEVTLIEPEKHKGLKVRLFGAVSLETLSLMGISPGDKVVLAALKMRNGFPDYTIIGPY